MSNSDLPYRPEIASKPSRTAQKRAVDGSLAKDRPRPIRTKAKRACVAQSIGLLVNRHIASSVRWSLYALLEEHGAWQTKQETSFGIVWALRGTFKDWQARLDQWVMSFRKTSMARGCFRLCHSIGNIFGCAGSGANRPVKPIPWIHCLDGSKDRARQLDALRLEARDRYQDFVDLLQRVSLDMTGLDLPEDWEEDMDARLDMLLDWRKLESEIRREQREQEEALVSMKMSGTLKPENSVPESSAQTGLGFSEKQFRATVHSKRIDGMRKRQEGTSTRTVRADNAFPLTTLSRIVANMPTVEIGSHI